jgi:hypothetical protein
VVTSLASVRQQPIFSSPRRRQGSSRSVQVQPSPDSNGATMKPKLRLTGEPTPAEARIRSELSLLT